MHSNKNPSLHLVLPSHNRDVRLFGSSSPLLMAWRWGYIYMVPFVPPQPQQLCFPQNFSTVAAPWSCGIWRILDKWYIWHIYIYMIIQDNIWLYKIIYDYICLKLYMLKITYEILGMMTVTMMNLWWGYRPWSNYMVSISYRVSLKQMYTNPHYWTDDESESLVREKTTHVLTMAHTNGKWGMRLQHCM